MLVKFSEQNKNILVEKVNEDEPNDLSEEIDEETYEEMKNKFIEKKLMEERELKYKPTKDDLDKLDEFLKNINYQGPKFEENETEKISPTEEELNKLEELLLKFPKEDNTEIEDEEKIENEITPQVEDEIESADNEEEIEKVFFNPEENEVLYSDDNNEQIENKIDDEVVVVEEKITPQPIEMAPTAKILNYFKRND
jgi:hypothetical protein